MRPATATAPPPTHSHSHLTSHYIKNTIAPLRGAGGIFYVMAGQVAVAVSGDGAVAVAGLTKRFFHHIQKDFLINVWGYRKNIFLTFIVKLFF